MWKKQAGVRQVKNMVELGKKGQGVHSSTYGRKMQAVSWVNIQTEKYIRGEVTETDFITLQCIKNKFLALPGNPFALHPKPHANAHIRVDMQAVCINGISTERGKQQLKCKTYGDRVIFYNAQLARKIIAATKDKAAKVEAERRFKLLESLEDREGYIA